MIIVDPIFGRFQLPPFLAGLVQTAEVRRLSQIRLLNCLTPSLATLGEIRRYSHTLGVLYLWTLLPRGGYSEAEYRALAASVLAHDIGTPPFGHLFEYHLREASGWNHEQVIREMLWGHHAKEDSAHQVFAGRSASFRFELQRSGIDFELVEAIVRHKHPLSNLILGTLDLDNLDNVARMAHSLGQEDVRKPVTLLASQIDVSRSGEVLLDQMRAGGALERWSKLRRASYDVLVFDHPTVAAQAVLSEAIGQALEAEILSADDWCLSDEDLIHRLLHAALTKRSIALEYLGRLPSPIFTLQVNGCLIDWAFETRAAAMQAIQDCVSQVAPMARTIPYVFIDRGTFEKSLSFVNPEDRVVWNFGVQSKSVVFYAFSRSRRSLSKGQCANALRLLVERLKVPAEQILRCSISDDPSDVQPTLTLSAARN